MRKILEFYDLKFRKLLLISFLYSLQLGIVVYLKYQHFPLIGLLGIFLLSLLVLSVVRYLTEINRIPLYIYGKIIKDDDYENRAFNKFRKYYVYLLIFFHILVDFGICFS